MKSYVEDERKGQSIARMQEAAILLSSVAIQQIVAQKATPARNQIAESKMPEFTHSLPSFINVALRQTLDKRPDSCS